MNIQVIKSRRRTIGIEVHADGESDSKNSIANVISRD